MASRAALVSPAFDYLKDTLGVDDPGVLRMARHSALDWASTGTELMSIATAKRCGALGFAPAAVYDEDNPYIHHFPDGNAGIARALVKKLIPGVARDATPKSWSWLNSTMPSWTNPAMLFASGSTVPWSM